jgi:hypothetical protein
LTKRLQKVRNWEGRECGWILSNELHGWKHWWETRNQFPEL